MINNKILIFTNHFLPGYRAGGPVTSIANLVRLLTDNFEIIIVTSNKDLGTDKPYDNLIFDRRVKYDGFNIIYLSEINIKNIESTIKKVQPNIIYLNSFFSIFTRLVLLISIKNKFKIPVILAPRGELQENALDIKKVKKKVYLSIYKIMKLQKKIYFHVTDKIEYDRVKQMFSTNNISILSNIANISDNKPLSKNRDELKLIFISRIRDNKNLFLALKALSLCKGDIIFDIYGPIEDKNYWEKCKVLIEELPKNIIVKYHGVVHPSEILNVMQKYHALLLPTKTENFGHVIVEAMQLGLVPIISNKTPWIKLSEHKAGWDLDLSDFNEFSKVIDFLYKMDVEEYSTMSKNTMEYIRAKLNIDALKQKYIKLFTKKGK